MNITLLGTTRDICKDNFLFFTPDGPVNINSGGLILSYAITCESILGVLKYSNKVSLVILREVIKLNDGANIVAADIYTKSKMVSYI